MAKVKLTKKMKCVSVQQSIGRNNVMFAEDIKPGEKGPTARNAVTMSFQDAKDVAGFEPNKEYTITITE